MSLRFKSIAELGSGSWRIAEETPVKPACSKSKSLHGKRRARGRMPDDILWEAVSERWPHAVREMPAGVPGRRFRLDIGLQPESIAVEVDGFQYHAKYKKHFQSDIDR